MHASKHGKVVTTCARWISARSRARTHTWGRTDDLQSQKGDRQRQGRGSTVILMAGPQRTDAASRARQRRPFAVPQKTKVATTIISRIVPGSCKYKTTELTRVTQQPKRTMMTRVPHDFIFAYGEEQNASALLLRAAKSPLIEFAELETGAKHT